MHISGTKTESNQWKYEFTRGGNTITGCCSNGQEMESLIKLVLSIAGMEQTRHLLSSPVFNGHTGVQVGTIGSVYGWKHSK